MSERESLFHALGIGELLAVVASEASEHPFVGSDVQKAAWDEIKLRGQIQKIEHDRVLSLLYSARNALSSWDQAPAHLIDSMNAALKAYDAEVARFLGDAGDETDE